MAVKTGTATVPNGEAKCGYIRTEDYVTAGGKRAVISVIAPAAIDGTSTTLKWYVALSADGANYPLFDSSGAVENSDLAAGGAYEVPIETPYRWPFILFEMTDGSSADNQAAAREFTIVGTDL